MSELLSAADLDRAVRKFVERASKKRECSECAKLRRQLAPIMLTMYAQLQDARDKLKHSEMAIDLMRQDEADAAVAEWMAAQGHS